MMAKRAFQSAKSNEQTNKQTNVRTYERLNDWMSEVVSKFLRESDKQHIFLKCPLSNGFDCAATQEYKTKKMVKAEMYLYSRNEYTNTHRYTSEKNLSETSMAEAEEKTIFLSRGLNVYTMFVLFQSIR